MLNDWPSLLLGNGIGTSITSKVWLVPLLSHAEFYIYIYIYICVNWPYPHHQSSIINHQSSIINHQSSIINHQSSIINHHHQSSIINHQSSIINHQSSIINHQSSSSSSSSSPSPPPSPSPRSSKPPTRQVSVNPGIIQWLITHTLHLPAAEMRQKCDRNAGNATIFAAPGSQSVFHDVYPPSWIGGLSTFMMFIHLQFFMFNHSFLVLNWSLLL